MYFIDTATDGIDQIADILQDRTDIDAVHIVSHGEQGELQLGSSALTQNNIQNEYATELSVIGEALSEHGDILIYGCDFAAGEDGAAASQSLADLTGADITASVDDTGAAVKGGNWDLEYETGTIASRTIQAVSWAGILADKDGDGVDDIDDDNDGILDAVEGLQMDSISSGGFSVAPLAINGGDIANLVTGDVYIFTH